MITHDSHRTPSFPELWDQGDKEWVWIGWNAILRGASISTSVWTIPAGWTSHATLMDQTVADEDGITYDNANGIQLSTINTDGLHLIANKVTLDDGRIYERAVRIRVEDKV